MVKLIREENEALVKEIDCEIKNKFRWAWLQRTVSITVKIGKYTEEVTEKLSDYIAKCDVPGKAQCLYCNDVINYGSRGCVALIEHATKSKKHAEKIATRRSNYSLGAAFQVPSKSSQTAAVGEHITKPQSTDSKPLTALADRKAHSEALVLGVVAEHSLPLTLAPVILDTARELAKDPKALNHMNLERTTASYKMRFGLAKTFSEETIEELKSTPFSLNIDESTSNNDKRVLAILVSYYSSRKSGVIVEHLASLEVIRVNSQSLFNELDNFFKTHDIPWGNVVSILMDSCSVMRGSKNGLETKIRNTRAPQLLDIDGDSCHHLHNACKKFAKPFDNWVEHLQSDIHNDVKWSPDLGQYLQEVCDIMGIKFTMPERFITHKWLSCYDACNTNIHMVSALKVFYFPFLSEKDQLLYRARTLKELHLHHATDEGVKRVKEIWNTIGKKSLTDDGKRRKSRIADKLIVYYTKTITIMHFYLSVLPLLKEYVSLFQSNEPLIHVLHDKQKQVFTDFLSCFIKSEVLIGKSAKQLKNLNLENDEGQFLSLDDMFVGRGVSEVKKTSHKNDTFMKDFLKQASTAYILCGRHMQLRLPLHNPLLRSLSSLDPRARGHSATAKAMKKLTTVLEPFLTEEDLDKVHLEIHQFQLDSGLKIWEEGQRIDDWWAAVINGAKYAVLSKIAKVCLSCFHGPRVESSFNLMGDIIDIRSARMNIATFNAFQTVKYGLKSRNASSLQLFKKRDVKHDEIDARLCRNFRCAASCYIKEKEEKKQKKEEELQALREKQERLDSRASQKRKMEQAAKIARLAHQKTEKRKATERLQELAAKRKCLQ